MKTDHTGMKKIVIIIAFIVLWAGWLIGFPYYLMWLEGISLFTTLPDFTTIHSHFPDDAFRYAGSFLLQFYKYPVAAAAVQAAFPILSLLCWWAIVRKLFKDADSLLWMVFLPLPALLYFLRNDMALDRSCMVLGLSLVSAAAVSLFALAVRPFIRLPEFLHKTWLSVAVPAVCVSVSLVVICTDPINARYDEIAELEYLGKRQQWDKILEKVTPKDANENTFKRKYALLALSETGRLADDAFRYGLSGTDDFYFKKPDSPMTHSFNILFYRSVGMANPMVMLAYQQQTLSMTGLAFESVRTMADTYLRLKDYRLAKKYIDILDHSFSHRRWVKERLPQLEAIRDADPEYSQTGPRFAMQDFVMDMSSMVSRYPDDRKIADLLLCGVLAAKDGNKFLQHFRLIAPSQYPDGKNIPRIYQEALCPISSQLDRLTEGYGIDEDVWRRFMEFNTLISSGKANVARKKMYDTYWAYVFF
jgi:hypothetical protein